MSRQNKQEIRKLRKKLRQIELLERQALDRELNDEESLKVDKIKIRTIFIAREVRMSDNKWNRCRPYPFSTHRCRSGQPRSLSVTTRHVSTKTAHFEQFCWYNNCRLINTLELSVLNIYGKYKTPLLRHIWVYIHIEIENIQWITFSAYALLWEGPCLRFSDRIYNRLQNTGKSKLLDDMRIVLIQFIHY